MRDVYFSENGKCNVFLNFDIKQGCGQIAVFIYFGKEEIYEIVIQGNQYRHCINHKTVNGPNNYQSLKSNKSDSKAEVWERVTNGSMFIQSFMDVNGNTLKQTYQNECKHYCGYEYDQIYRYRLIEGHTIENLIDSIVNDVDAVLKHHQVLP